MLSACKSNAVGEVASLLQQSPSALQMETPFGTWLHVAASSNSREVAEYLMSRGLDPNTRSGTLGGSALNEAASSGHQNMVAWLHERGAKFDTTEPERNPLFGAIYGGHIDVVKFLVDHGIDYRVRYTGTYMKNMDALAFAVERGQSAIAAYLRSLQNAA